MEFIFKEKNNGIVARHTLKEKPSTQDKLNNAIMIELAILTAIGHSLLLVNNKPLIPYQQVKPFFLNKEISPNSL